MPNIHTGQTSVNPPSNALVGASSSVLITQNISRVGLTLVNLSSSTVYLGLSNNAAVLNAGIVLLPNGGSWTMDEYSFNNETINAIAHGAGNIVAVQEFVR